MSRVGRRFLYDRDIFVAVAYLAGILAAIVAWFWMTPIQGSWG
ncbi:MAG: hypothetical protein ABSF71_13060 [Terriglobia bacterium]